MLLEKVKKANLCGRSGSNFFTYKKWESLINESGEKYLICNAAESEPEVYKDRWLIENELPKITRGIKLIVEELNISKSFFYVKKDYYKKFKQSLRKVFVEAGLNIDIKIKEDRYIAGEETAVINSIENGKPKPRNKPPYPTKKGLKRKPTLVHNLETFYAVTEIASGNYEKQKFFYLFGDIENKGIYKLNKNLTIEEILKETDNFPDFDFLVQVGGKIGGLFYSSNDLDFTCDRLAAIRVIRKDNFNKIGELKRITDFLMYGNCDQCTPCREGIYRLNEMTKKGSLDEKTLDDLIFVMSKTSLCPLGNMAAEVIKSLLKV